MEKNKSRSLAVAANLVFFIGIAACALGAIAYLIMHQLDYQIKFIGAFQWEHLLYVAGVAAVVIVIALILRIASNVARKKEMAFEAEEINDSNDLEEDNNEEECCNEVAEDAETDETAVCECEAEASEKKGVYAVLKGKFTPENKEKLVATVKENAPVIIAVAATAAVTITAAAMISKSKERNRKAKIRRTILDLFY